MKTKCDNCGEEFESETNPVCPACQTPLKAAKGLGLKQVQGEVVPLPTKQTLYACAGRYENGRGGWFGGSLHPSAREAVASVDTFGYAERVVVKVELPV